MIQNTTWVLSKDIESNYVGKYSIEAAWKDWRNYENKKTYKTVKNLRDSPKQNVKKKFAVHILCRHKIASTLKMD